MGLHDDDDAVTPPNPSDDSASHSHNAHNEQPSGADRRSEADELGPEGTTPWWDTDDAISALKMERSVKPDETNEELTKRLLDEAGPSAAQSIIHIALHGQSENTRLRAAQYITELQVGDAAGGSVKPAWEAFVADVVSKAELHANATADTTED